MRIKKFTAGSVKEATEQMKQELGPEAIVLHSRRLTGAAVMKSFGRDQFEITGAVDDVAEPAPVSTYSRRDVRRTFEAAMTAAAPALPAASPDELPEPEPGPAAATPRRRAASTMADVSDMVQLKADMEEMKQTMQQLTHQLRHKHFGDLPEALKEVYLALLQQDIEEKYAVSITNTVMKKLPPQQQRSRTAVEQLVVQTIAGGVTMGPGPAADRKRRVVVLVGPTGVGKTTTIAKLAAVEKLANGRSVGLISCDTYRIGAIEQLKTFAVIADIPMQVVYRAADIAGALKKFQKQDVVFIDTVGRGQKAKKELQELRKMVDAAKADEVHLVLSAQTNMATLSAVVDSFSIISPTHLLFSKMDEAAIFGPLYNIAQKTRIPVSFFTTGQAVPDDISVSDGMTFARMVYQGTYAHA